MGGQIELSSQSGGVTRVTVSLPSTAPVGPLAPARAHGRLLRCDDDPVSRPRLAYPLSQAGHGVIEAEEGERTALIACSCDPLPLAAATGVHPRLGATRC